MVDFYSRTYDSVLVIGDFNLEVNSPIIHAMMNDHNFSSVIQTPTCFKSTDGSCIDLILTNYKNGCFNIKTFETGFSDFHCMVYTNLKATYTRLPPGIIRFRSYQTFSQEQFRAEIAQKLSECQTNTYEDIQQRYLDTLNKYAPTKEITIRAYNKPHLSKNLRKAIMKRSRLKRIANINHSDENIRNYKNQRNFVDKMNKQAKTKF